MLLDPEVSYCFDHLPFVRQTTIFIYVFIFTCRMFPIGWKRPLSIYLQSRQSPDGCRAFRSARTKIDSPEASRRQLQTWTRLEAVFRAM